MKEKPGNSVFQAEPSIWSSVVRGLIFPLQERGLEPHSLLRDCEINATDLEHPHTPIPIRKYLRYMERAATLADDPVLGLRIGQSCGPEMLGALGFLFLSSQSITEALSNLVHYQTLLQDVTHLGLRREGEELWFNYDLIGVSANEGRQDIEFSLSYTTRLIRLFGAGDMQISGVNFRHENGADIRHYERLLGAKCAFGQETNTIRISKVSLNRRGKMHDPILLQILKDYLDVDLAKKMQIHSFSEQLEQIVYDGYIKPPITALKAASHLGISVPTLNRRLRAEGKHFKKLVDDVQYGIAKRYLSDSPVQVTQISDAMGFSSTASFTRAFSRWSGGTSPSEYRKLNSKHKN